MKVAPTDDRIHILDMARGWAVFGILLINVTFYSTSLQAIQWQIDLWTDSVNQIVQTVLSLFAEGKFLAVFSFLFGYSMIVFYERADQKGLRFGRLFTRRLLALLIFGLLHGWLIWFGDILFHYALLGFVLLLFYRRKPRTLLVWSLVLLTIVPVLL